MKRIVMAVGLAVALALVASPREARAQTVTWNWTFVTIDAVSAGNQKLFVTGIPEGEAIPVTAELSFYDGNVSAPSDRLAACQRVAMLAMERPGQYKLQATAKTSLALPYCRLVRVTP